MNTVHCARQVSLNAFTTLLFRSRAKAKAAGESAHTVHKGYSAAMMDILEEIKTKVGYVEGVDMSPAQLAKAEEALGAVNDHVRLRTKGWRKDIAQDGTVDYVVDPNQLLIITNKDLDGVGRPTEIVAEEWKTEITTNVLDTINWQEALE